MLGNHIHCCLLDHQLSHNMDRPDSSNITSVSMRPRTAQSRPMTARPTTAASAHEAGYVVALLEGRGVSREVGLAALNKDTGSCVLVQVCPCALVARDFTNNIPLEKDC